MVNLNGNPTSASCTISTLVYIRVCLPVATGLEVERNLMLELGMWNFKIKIFPNFFMKTKNDDISADVITHSFPYRSLVHDENEEVSDGNNHTVVVSRGAKLF